MPQNIQLKYLKKYILYLYGSTNRKDLHNYYFFKKTAVILKYSQLSMLFKLGFYFLNIKLINYDFILSFLNKNPTKIKKGLSESRSR